MILHASILALVVALYIIVRTIVPLRIHRGFRLLLALLVIAAAGKFHLLYLIEGENFFTPDLPAAVVWGGCWAFCSALGYAMALAVADMVRLPLYLALWAARRRRPGNTWRTISQALNLSLLVLVLSLTAHGVINGTAAPDISKVTVQLPHMPVGSAPIQIVQLTDLHADSTRDAAFYQDIVERANSLRPDIVLITGDFADGPVERFGAALAPLAELDAPMGVYAVTGNHDFFHGTQEWLNYLHGLGISFIDGETVTLCTELEGGVKKNLQLIGIHDRMFTHNGPRARGLSDMKDEITDGSIPTVLLSHQPAVADEASRYNIDLQLSGHTHGGQFPGLQQLVARMNHGYVYGLYQVGNMQLYVSAGTCLWTPVCLRLGVPAEITLITIVPPKE